MKVNMRCLRIEANHSIRKAAIKGDVALLDQEATQINTPPSVNKTLNPCAEKLRRQICTGGKKKNSRPEMKSLLLLRGRSMNMKVMGIKRRKVW
jgi:hypothetical protein